MGHFRHCNLNTCFPQPFRSYVGGKFSNVGPTYILSFLHLIIEFQNWKCFFPSPFSPHHNLSFETDIAQDNEFMGPLTYKVFNLYFSIRYENYNPHLHTTKLFVIPNIYYILQLMHLPLVICEHNYARSPIHFSSYQHRQPYLEQAKTKIKFTIQAFLRILRAYKFTFLNKIWIPQFNNCEQQLNLYINNT